MYILVQWSFVFIKIKKVKSNLRRKKKNGLTWPILKIRLNFTTLLRRNRTTKIKIFFSKDRKGSQMTKKQANKTQTDKRRLTTSYRDTVPSRTLHINSRRVNKRLGDKEGSVHTIERFKGSYIPTKIYRIRNLQTKGFLLLPLFDLFCVPDREI